MDLFKWGSSEEFGWTSVVERLPRDIHGIVVLGPIAYPIRDSNNIPCPPTLDHCAPSEQNNAGVQDQILHTSQHATEGLKTITATKSEVRYGAAPDTHIDAGMI